MLLRNMMEAKYKNRNGFTLIELVITISVIGILSIIAGGIINIGVNSFLFVSTHSVLTREAQDAMSILYETIINTDPDGITTARNNRFYFINMHGDEVQFRYDRRRGYLRYRVLGQSDWREILNNIPRNEFSFSYFSGEGSSWDNADEIKRVKIEFTLSMADENESYQTEIYLRN